jgi:2'-5' RNA ligase
MTDKIRVFLSIDIDDSVLLTKISDIQSRLNQEAAKMKLTKNDNIHFTWRFFGDTSISMIDSIHSELEKLNHSPFTVKISGVSAFPRINSPRIIWVGVSDNRNIMVELKKKTDELISVLGYHPEKKKFIPHATIARVRAVTNRETIKQNLLDLADIQIGDMTVDSINMTKSTLTPSGPIYETLWKIHLE